MFLDHQMTSERSCDTEDWSNDAENSALITGKKIHFKTHSNSKQYFSIAIIFHNIAVFIK